MGDPAIRSHQSGRPAASRLCGWPRWRGQRDSSPTSPTGGQGFFRGLLLLPGCCRVFCPPVGFSWANCAGYWASAPWS